MIKSRKTSKLTLKVIPVAVHNVSSTGGQESCPLKILIADDHEVVRRGLREILLENFPDAEFNEATNGQQALDQIHSNQFNFALLDLAMPYRTGIDVVTEIRKTDSEIPLFILSMYPPDQISQRALRAGATAYLTKDRVAEDLIDVVRKALDGEDVDQENCRGQVTDESDDGSDLPKHGLLSPREFQVLCSIGAGKPLKEISIDLSVASRTVSTYRRRVLDKMGMTSNAELIKYVIDHKLLKK